MNIILIYGLQVILCTAGNPGEMSCTPVYRTATDTRSTNTNNILLLNQNTQLPYYSASGNRKHRTAFKT